MQTDVGANGRAALANYAARWQLEPREAGFETNSSWLQRVRVRVRDERAFAESAPAEEVQEAVLKVAKPQSDERPGMALLAWWQGEGAVPVLRQDANAVLMVEAGYGATGTREAHSGDLADDAAYADEEAFDILIDAICRLHGWRARAGLVRTRPLADWPAGLVPLTAVRDHVFSLPAVADPVFVRWREFAQKFDVMGDAPRPLHGDVHHGNVLWLAGERRRDGAGAASQTADKAEGDTQGRWVVIDPKGLLGDVAYDFANLFFNPMAQPERVNQGGRMWNLAERVAKAVDCGPEHVLDFAYLYGGFSTAWGWAEDWRPARLEQFVTLENLWLSDRS